MPAIDWAVVVGTLAAVIAACMAVFSWRAARPNVRISSAGFAHGRSGSQMDLLLLIELRNTGGGAATLQWMEARIPISAGQSLIAAYETDERPDPRGRAQVGLVVTPALHALRANPPTGWRAGIFQRRRIVLTGELVNGKTTTARGPSGWELAELARRLD